MTSFSLVLDVSERIIRRFTLQLDSPALSSYHLVPGPFIVGVGYSAHAHSSSFRKCLMLCVFFVRHAWIG